MEIEILKYSMGTITASAIDDLFDNQTNLLSWKAKKYFIM